MSAIECLNLSKSFGPVQAVSGVSLRLSEGQFLALLGPSGCGKTTLLRLIAGFESPDEGSLCIGDAEVSRPGMVVPPERRRVGMVFQDYALFPHLDVAANVAYGLARGAERASRVATLLDLVGLAGLERRMPHQLSGGQQQRVALARALAPAPAAVLLDEPFSNLDAGLRARVRGEVADILRRAGAAAVFVTHDQEEALSIADTVAVMCEGRVLQVAPPRQLYLQPATRSVAALLGDALFVPAEGRGTTAESALGTLPLLAPHHGPIDVLLRPEMLAVEPDPHGSAAVVSCTFFGHSQVVRLRLADGTELRARVPSYVPIAPGLPIAARVASAVHAYPR